MPLSKPIETRVENQVVFNADCYDLFASRGLNTFQSLWGIKAGEVIKDTGHRSVIRFEVPLDKREDGDNYVRPRPVRVFYLKKHSRQQAGWVRRLLGRFLPGLRLSEGAGEFQNLCDFRRAGLATVKPVAVGERFISSSFVESFLITEDFAPFVSIEDLVLKMPETLSGSRNQEKRRNILREIAAYARKMHNKRFNHRDFNATHILIDDVNSDKPLVAVFDLQRIDRNPLGRFRWAVKALAELNFTLPPEVFSEDDRLYLFLSYAGRAELNLAGRLYWAWIKKKTARIARHTYKRWARKRVLRAKAHEEDVS